ncbi:MAG: DUF4129 domain-containing protein [Chroococcales cyanobacterium]
MATEYQKESLGWQLRLLQQRLGEWWELKTSRINIPDIPGPSWLDSPIWGVVARAFFWIALTVLICWVILQMMEMITPYLHQWKQQLNSSVANRTATTSFKDLSVGEWLRRSQKFQQQGNYREACFCLYQAMLQHLHSAGLIPHQSSRTDGEYLKLVQQLPQAQLYQTILMTHQQLCFSNIEASNAMFEECQQAYQAIAIQSTNPSQNR